MELLRARCDDRLQRFLTGIDLQQLSRVPASRLEQSAIPNVGSIELVSGEVFESDYQRLYTSMFHGGERERPDLIVDRLKDDFANKRSGLAPYRVIGIRDKNGEAIAGAQFSVLMLRAADDGSTRFASPYVQYIYVRSQNRRQDLSEVLHTLVLAIATTDARVEGRTVSFTLFETEPPNHGVEQSSRTNATERTTIHTRSGAVAMMLRSRVDGTIKSAHVQPGLEPGDGPLTVTWVIRPSPVFSHYDLNKVGEAAIAAYYQSLRDEGFPEENIALAERMVTRRRENADFCDLQLSEITTNMYHNLE